MPYVEAGTIPPNWESPVKHSTEIATAQDVYLAETWLQFQSNEGASDILSYHFNIVTDHHKRQKTNTSGSSSSNKDIPILVSEGVKSHEASLPTSQTMNQSEANSFASSRSKSNNGRAGVQIGTYNSTLYRNSSSHDFDTQSLTITKRLNPHENELRQSACLRKSWEREELQKRKAHSTHGTTATTKVAFGVF